MARIERLLADSASGACASEPPPTLERHAGRKAAIRQRALQNRARLEPNFTRAAAGPVSPGAERVARAAISSRQMRKLQVQPVDSEVRCRATICAVRVAFAAATDAGTWTSSLSMALAPQYGDARIAMMLTPNGDTEAMLHTVQPGGDARLDLR